jgi:hypothetical protein
MSSALVIEFAKSTQNGCMCLGIIVIFIMLFMISPLNSYFVLSIIGKIVIVVLLIYILWYNTHQTNKFSKQFNVNILNENEAWNHIKTNVLCSYIFSVFLLVLTFSVIRKMF